ncbi:MAG: hypothetical protein C0394_00510 [Syntrophus sp. (in: bacteria)]|nr:hypothetical protein [Syntrophus sp. (in: bacteria)]
MSSKALTVVVNSMMIATAALAAVLTGIVGYGRPQGAGHVSLYDYEYFFYEAGRKWLAGLNPYDDFFPYPPNSSLLFMILSGTDLETSKGLFLILNGGCILVFVYLCLRLYHLTRENNPFLLLDFKSSLLAAMIIGNTAVANVLWAGQTSILFSTALLASYYCYIRSRDIWSGLFLALALIKPQLAYTFLLWLILEKRWKILFVSIIGTVLLGIVPIYHRGPITSVLDWVNVLNTYVQGEYETFWNLFGLKPLLQNIGIHISGHITVILSVLSVVLIHRYGLGGDRIKLLGVLAIIGLLLGQAHQYDLVIMASILPYYFNRVDISRDSLKSLVWICLIFVVVNFPRKLLLLTDLRLLHHHREIVFIILLFFLLTGRTEEKGRTFVET